MHIFIILICIELITLIVLKDHLFKISKTKFYLALCINLLLSAWLWYLLISINSYEGYYDDPGNIRAHMNLTGMLTAVVFPRVLMSIFHFTGKILMLRKGGHSRKITAAGIVTACLIFSVVALGSVKGRFNFKTEEVTVTISDLPDGLNGLKIVHISDLHLSSFNGHYEKLQEVMEEINTYKPDIILNTGDFINYGWREYDRSDTILLKAKSRYGNFAVLGNHDSGTYLPGTTESGREATRQKITELITASGYRVLNDEHIIINISGVPTAIIGVQTGGRHPGIIHGDLDKALLGLDSVDFKILLCHDPNQWGKDVTGSTDIDLTLAGHTHGMQMGIITKRFRWSPAKYIYPYWNGLFSDDDQYLYVNRGLGVLAIPLRIWMPPEITLLTLVKE